MEFPENLATHSYSGIFNYFQPFSGIFSDIILFSYLATQSYSGIFNYFQPFQRFFVNLPENPQKWLYSGNLTHPNLRQFY